MTKCFYNLQGCVKYIYANIFVADTAKWENVALKSNGASCDARYSVSFIFQYVVHCIDIPNVC